MIYEHSNQELLPARLFLARLLKHVLLTSAQMTVSPGIDILGHHVHENLSGLDALLNATRIREEWSRLPPR